MGSPPSREGNPSGRRTSRSCHKRHTTTRELLAYKGSFFGIKAV